jgi:D-methionine transport system ATP-binding protein
MSSFIQIKNVYKSYTTNPILNSVNVNINKGDIYGFIGYSGAGKSTLLRLINLLERPTAGQIFIDNIDITTYKGHLLRKLRSKIGMIFQEFNLLASYTVQENIALPLKILGKKQAEINKAVQELIALVHLEGKEHCYPSQLSGGQKQRVGIARALVNNPNILLCDEATSALDPANTKSILKLLKDIQAKTNVTIILITHEMDVIAEICNKVAVLDKGYIVENGLVSEVFKNPKHSITKEFVVKGYENKIKDDLDIIIDNIAGGKFLKLHFDGTNVKSSILSDVILKFQIQVNILEASTYNKNSATAGYMILHINVEEHQLNDIINFIKSQNIAVEVINNESI